MEETIKQKENLIESMSEQNKKLQREKEESEDEVVHYQQVRK